MPPLSTDFRRPSNSLREYAAAVGAPERPAILVADDEPLLQRLVERVLEGAGFPVVATGDAETAVRRVADATRTPRIGAVVLDVSMPPFGGDEALSRIVAVRPDVGIVVTSGMAPDARLFDAIERHAGVFLPKPFSPEALLRAVDEVLRRKGPASPKGA
jgi:CheY-like chemotaxis protein